MFAYLFVFFYILLYILILLWIVLTATTASNNVPGLFFSSLIINRNMYIYVALIIQVVCFRDLVALKKKRELFQCVTSLQGTFFLFGFCSSYSMFNIFFECMCDVYIYMIWWLCVARWFNGFDCGESKASKGIKEINVHWFEACLGIYLKFPIALAEMIILHQNKCTYMLLWIYRSFVLGIWFYKNHECYFSMWPACKIHLFLFDFYSS